MARLQSWIDSLSKELGTMEHQIEQPGTEREALKSEEEKEKLATTEK
ncbi:MAG: hypothetical protein OXL40_02535 [Bacteroidota bacterium]|nr:hypothetical protein [Bacteroidota bacterium]